VQSEITIYFVIHVG